jgi:hypothetical protein
MAEVNDTTVNKFQRIFLMNINLETQLPTLPSMNCLLGCSFLSSVARDVYYVKNNSWHLVSALWIHFLGE